MRKSVAAAAICMIVLLPSWAQGQSTPPAPPSNLTATDHPWDNGTRVDLRWTASSDDGALQGYIIRKKTVEAPAFTRVEIVPRGTSAYTVTELTRGRSYLFQATSVAKDASESAPAATAAPIAATTEWFDGTRVWFLLTLVLFCSTVVIFIAQARKGKTLKVRKIAGLEAIDEAVGRATEMGRPCLFIPGILDLNDIQTLTAMTMLARVAKTTAEYDARLEVPTSNPLVMTVARETVQSAFLAAGRPEAYDSDAIYFVTGDQFGYVAHVQGLMAREKPAACFYMGAFFAESLILAEAGNRIGAIQIAGTAQVPQLPFFVAACDYALIGEEFFAASAYLSGDPEQLGSLKGQDVGKLLVAAFIVVGVTGATIAALTGSPLMQRMVDFLVRRVLT